MNPATLHEMPAYRVFTGEPGFEPGLCSQQGFRLLNRLVCREIMGRRCYQQPAPDTEGVLRCSSSLQVRAHEVRAHLRAVHQRPRLESVKPLVEDWYEKDFNGWR